MNSRITIEIKTNPRPTVLKAFITFGVSTLYFVAAKKLGGDAMEWFAFIIITIAVLGLGINEAKKDNGLTIDQARVKLDEIAAKDADHG